MGRGGRSSSRSSRNKATQDPNATGASTGLIAGAAGASLLSGAGGTTITSCQSGDTSAYCKFVKGFNILKMILSVLGFVIIAVILYISWKK